MDLETCEIEAGLESTHWWFVGRRSLFRRELKHLISNRPVRVLDVGIGGGSNLRMLTEAGFRFVVGIDFLTDNLLRARQRHDVCLAQSDATVLPFADNTFDIVLATDVLEHLDDDEGALREWERVLRPGGTLLVTVPAFQSLWGLQDIVSQHRRRYRREQIVQLFTRTRLGLDRSYYFNWILFGPIWLARQLLRSRRSTLKSENEINSPAINAVLTRVFLFDVMMAPLLRLGFGVSVLARGRKAPAL